MGAPSVVWLPLLVASNLLSLVGLGVGAFYLQQQQLALRELQLQLGPVRPPNVLAGNWRDRGQLGGAGPDEPEAAGGARLGSGWHTSSSPLWTEARDKQKGQTRDSLFWGLVFLVGVLTLLVVVGLLWQRWRGVSDIEELTSSPSERRKRLAQRQLAEVRLRKHGFGQ